MPRETSLRRSCQACVKAKRRCDMSTPKCGRCNSKRLSCAYENEPLTQPALSAAHPWSVSAPAAAVPCVEDLNHTTLSVVWDVGLGSGEQGRTKADNHNSQKALSPTTLMSRNGAIARGVDVYESDQFDANMFHRRAEAMNRGVSFANNPGLTFLRPTIWPTQLTLDDDTFFYIMRTLRNSAVTFAQGGKTTFIHPRLMRDMPSNEIIARIFQLCCYANTLTSLADRAHARRDLEEMVQNLIQHTNRCNPNLQCLLLAMQALIMAQITLTVGNRDWEKGVTLDQRIQDLKVLTAWSHSLYGSAPWTQLNAVNANQSWLFAESIRRTLLISHMLCGTVEILQYGAFGFNGLVGTLPYDYRTELWDQPDGPGDDMDGCAVARTSKLKSFRQLVYEFESGELKPRDVGHFERLLLVACRGHTSVSVRIQVS